MVTSSPSSPLILESSPPESTSQSQLASSQLSSQQPSQQLSQQPSQLSQIQQPSQRRKQRRVTVQKGSLFDLLRRHSGASLFVRPICWFDLHAKLLGVEFTELPPCTEPLPLNEPGSPPTKGHLRPSIAITDLSKALSEIISPSVAHFAHVSTAIRTVFATMWPDAFRNPQLLPELHIFYGDKVYRDSVRSQIMWNYPETMNSSQCSFRTASTHLAGSQSMFGSIEQSSHNPANLPMVCYMGKAQLASIRRNMFRVAPAPGKRWNEPVYRLQQLRSRSLMPEDPDQDIHMVGIFLGMAQRHFYTAADPRRRESRWPVFADEAPCPNFVDLSLRIFTHDSETQEFIVYTGHLTAKFLERFHYPYRAPRNDEGQVDGIKIEYTRVPIWPILGLRERLGQAFGEEVVGSFDPTVMETWNDEETEIPCSNNSTKRKREVLVEVLNTSFDDDSENDQSMNRNAKKRCLREGPPLGMVA